MQIFNSRNLTRLKFCSGSPKINLFLCLQRTTTYNYFARVEFYSTFVNNNKIIPEQGNLLGINTSSSLYLLISIMHALLFDYFLDNFTIIVANNNLWTLWRCVLYANFICAR